MISQKGMSMNGCSPFVRENDRSGFLWCAIRDSANSILFWPWSRTSWARSEWCTPLLVLVRGTPNWHMSVALCSFQWDLMHEIQDAHCRCCSQTMKQKEVPSHGPLEGFARFASIARKLKWLEVLKCKLFWDTAMCSIKSHWMAWHLGKPLVQSPIDHSKFLLHRACSSRTLGLAGKILVSDIGLHPS